MTEISLSTPKSEATKALFTVLESSGLRYAVLRNYENFPDFGHDIDLVMHHDDLPAWRCILQKHAAEENWKAVYECTHWGGSGSLCHNVEVFRCYLQESDQYLQIDTFHGFLVWGLPLFDESFLLEGIIRDERGFTHIHPALENAFRLLQIHRLSKIGPSEKISRYIGHILQYDMQYGNVFQEILLDLLGKDAIKALFALKQNDMKRFLSLMSRIKWDIAVRYWLCSPATASLDFWNRMKSYFRFHYKETCGLVISITRESKIDDCLIKALTLLKDFYIIPGWGIENKLSFIQKWRLLERGGVVIRWQSCNMQSAIKPISFASLSELVQAIILKLECRHQILYQRKDQDL
jgi:hypothetical protein